MFVQIEKPKFLPSLSKAIGKNSGDWNWRSVLPIWGTICLLIGVGVSYNMPVEFWSKERQVSAVLVYIGIFILNGLFVSLCWNIFTKMYEAISAPKFFSYLVAEELMYCYVVYIQLVHSLQLFAVFTSALGIVILLLEPPRVIYDQIAFGAMIFITACALKTVSHITHVMQDILWQKAIIDDATEKPGRRQSLMPAE